MVYFSLCLWTQNILFTRNKWESILVRLLFRGLKWAINILLRSLNWYGKAHSGFWSEIRYRFQGSTWIITIVVVLIHIARDENAGAKVCGKLSKELNVTNIKYHQLDITSQESINKLRDHVMEKFGGLDVLINNSGVLLKVIQNLTSFVCNWIPEDCQSNPKSGRLPISVSQP